jgi:YVTN family beta-propeller protein
VGGMWHLRMGLAGSALRRRVDGRPAAARCGRDNGPVRLPRPTDAASPGPVSTKLDADAGAQTVLGLERWGVHTRPVSVPPDGGSPPVGEPSSAPRLLTDATGDADVHAFLIADVRGWTMFTQERGDEDAARLAGRFAEVTRSVVEAHRGNVLELRGDEALVVFGSPRWAIRGAVALQQRFVEETIADPSLPLTVGIGLDAGEAVPVEGGYRGGALNVAARLCSLARAGEVLASREIVHLALRVDGVRFTERGQAELKGLDKPVHVVAVRSEERDDAAAIAPFVRSTAPARRRWKLAAGVVALAVVATLIAVPILGREAGSSQIEPNSIGVLDPESGEVTATVGLEDRPGSVATSADAVWVTNPDVATVTRIDANELAVVDTVQVGQNPTGIAVGFDAVWVVESGGPTVSRISPETNTVVGEPIRVGNGPAGVAVGEGSVWVANRFDATISRIDPNPGGAVETIPVGLDPRGIAVGFGSVWVALAGSNTVVRVDPETNSVIRPIGVGNAPESLAVSADGVWVVNTLDDSVMRISPDTDSVVDTIPVGDGSSGMAVVQETVWVANESDGTLSHIEPGEASASETVVGSVPQGLAGVNGDLWVAVQGTTTSHRGGTLRLMSLRAPFPKGPTLDSAAAYDPYSWQWVHLLGDGLVAFEPVGGSNPRLVPDLATSIPTPTNDGRTYSFEIRSGIRYSNGEVVAPADFRRALERGFLVDPTGGVGYLFSGLVGGRACEERPRSCDLSRGIETDDGAGTITFQLVAPDPEFLYKLTLPFAYPVPPSTPDEPLHRAGVPGTGPYMLEAPMTSEGLALVRNPQFQIWSPAAQPDGYVDRIELTFGVDPEAQIDAVAAGDADVALDAYASDRLGEILVEFAAQVYTSPQAITLFVVLDTERPPFNTLEVRRAINLALDRDRVVQIFGGEETTLPTCQQLPPNFPGYAPFCPYTMNPGPEGEGSWTARDLEAAQRIVRRSGTEGMRVVIAYPPYFGPEWSLLGDYLVELVNELGYRGSVRPLTYEKYNSPGGEFEMLAGAWIADYPAASTFISNFFSCDATTYPSGFCDPAIDAMIDRASRLQLEDPAASGALWAEIDRAVVRQAPYLWLGNGRVVEFVSDRVGNYQWHPQWGSLLNQLWVQ